MSKSLTTLRRLFAIVAGYAVMAILITLVQEGIFGGISFGRSSPAVLLWAGVMTFISAGVGGFVASWVAGQGVRWPALVMAMLVVAETAVLTATAELEGPVWFDMLAAISLIVGILAGSETCARFKMRSIDDRRTGWVRPN